MKKSNMTNTISDTFAVIRIHALLDGTKWTPDTLEQIRDIITMTGRTIREPDELTTHDYTDVSTSHVTQKDMELLEKDSRSYGGNPVFAYPYDEGAFVLVMDSPDYDLDTIRAYGYSTLFVSLLEKALAQNCYMIRLDSDGEEHDNLETSDKW